MENHPKMMEMGNKIISLEKDIYEATLKDTPREIIFENILKINRMRTQIVEKKTNCRDLVKETISEQQWNSLVAMAM